MGLTGVQSCFFFQAEDGIRDIGVTGVQTCALPISATLRTPASPGMGQATHTCAGRVRGPVRPGGAVSGTAGTACGCRGTPQIGRAARRGRGENSVDARPLKKKTTLVRARV